MAALNSCPFSRSSHWSGICALKTRGAWGVHLLVACWKPQQLWLSWVAVLSSWLLLLPLLVLVVSSLLRLLLWRKTKETHEILGCRSLTTKPWNIPYFDSTCSTILDAVFMDLAGPFLEKLLSWVDSVDFPSEPRIWASNISRASSLLCGICLIFTSSPDGSWGKSTTGNHHAYLGRFALVKAKQPMQVHDECINRPLKELEGTYNNVCIPCCFVLFHLVFLNMASSCCITFWKNNHLWCKKNVKHVSKCN